MENFDVIIVGAGLSGVSMARHLQQECPDARFLLLEARGAIGGTWDLFRYPGIRSDSEMYTLGYRFKPWRDGKAIAAGGTIRAYIEETVTENNIGPHIRFHHKVLSAQWSSADAQWTVRVETPEGVQTYHTRFISFCSGYFRYDRGYTPEFPGVDRFRGRIIHPQLWPEDLDTKGKNIVVIGSGATAVTLIPELAKTAASVTMLQRSPTYVISRPSVDAFAQRLRRVLPERWAYALTRMKNIGMQQVMFNYARRRPNKMRAKLREGIVQHLPDRPDVLPHFEPRYNPWDQRLCLVPDGDLFASIADHKAEVVTDTIEHFDETGIALKSGKHLDADVIVTATGLDLQLFGGAELEVDGRVLKSGDLIYYKGMMFEGVPNLINVFGYTNASWTLKADLTSEFLCRLLNTMKVRKAAIACPRLRPGEAPGHMPFADLSSGYITRVADRLPHQGARPPWRLYQSYLRDLINLRYGRIDDGVLQLTPAGATA